MKEAPQDAEGDAVGGMSNRLVGCLSPQLFLKQELFMSSSLMKHTPSPRKTHAPDVTSYQWSH